MSVFTYIVMIDASKFTDSMDGLHFMFIFNHHILWVFQLWSYPYYCYSIILCVFHSIKFFHYLVLRSFPRGDSRTLGSFEWPTPQENSSSWVTELASALAPQHTSGTPFEVLAPKLNNNYVNETLLKSILDNTLPNNTDSQFVYTKLQKNPHLRKSLASLNTAKSFVYSSRAFGQQNWYKESFNVLRGLRSNADRRKFRFGLKSNIEFLVQLDIQNLKTLLVEKDSEQKDTIFQSPPTQLSDGSFVSTLHKSNAKRCEKVCILIERISANMQFSQSLSEFFANDDMLEPALMLISDALRKGPNLLKTLHGGSVAFNAMIYRHRAGDHDKGNITISSVPTKKSIKRKQ